MTIYEIAKIAQTSPATVSLALNNRPGVSPVTRQKILEIAEKSGYISHKKDSGTDSKVIKLIAVSKPETSNIHNFRTSFFADIINWVQRRCSELGYSMLYSILPHDEFVRVLSSSESSHPAAGFLLLGTYLDDQEIELLTEVSAPLVLLDRNCPLIPINTVGINNYMGAYHSVISLAELGHSHIGYIQSASDVGNLTERRQGFLDALSDRHLSSCEDFCFQCNSYVPDGVDVLCQQLRNCTQLPTAFFCENDYNALCLISALSQLNKRIPEDVSIIGFDDVPECIITSPQLSTVRVNRQALAYTAVDLLHSIISGHSETEATTRSISINVDLIKRASARELQHDNILQGESESI